MSLHTRLTVPRRTIFDDAGSVEVALGRSMEHTLMGSGDVGQNDFARFGLSSARLTSYDDRLVLLICDQLLERVFSNHEQMRAWVLNKDSWIGRCKAANLIAVVSDLLRELHCEDGHALVGVDADQDGCTDLREYLFLLLESLLDVVKHIFLTEVIEGEKILSPLHIRSLHLF